MRFRHTLAAFLAGTGVGACVPARAGQLVRLGVLRSRVGSSTFAGLVSTLVADSAFDAVLTTLIAVGVVIAAGPGVVDGARFLGPFGQHPLIAGAAAFAVILALFALAVHHRGRIRSLLRDARCGWLSSVSPADTSAESRHGRRLAAYCASLRPTGF